MNKERNDGRIAVFDLDGTLIDSKQKLNKDVVQAMDLLGVKISLEEVRGDWYSLARSYGISEAEFDRAFEQRKSWEQSLRDGDAPLFEDSIRCLESLRDSGVKLSALTKSTKEYTDTKLDFFGLRGYFGDRVAITPVDSASDKLPEARALIEQVGLDTLGKAYFIGDSAGDVTIAGPIGALYDLDTRGFFLDRSGRGIDSAPGGAIYVCSLDDVPHQIIGGRNG